MGLVNGKVCLVTGGASNPGLGHAIAHKLASEGAIVIVTDVDGDGAERTAAEITAQGGQAQAWAQDVTDEALWDQTFDRIRAEHGKIDALINNAGISMRSMFETVDLAVLKQVMDINFWGTVYATHAALPHIKAVKGGIIGISSIAGYRGLPVRTGYSASKFATSTKRSSI